MTLIHAPAGMTAGLCGCKEERATPVDSVELIEHLHKGVLLGRRGGGKKVGLALVFGAEIPQYDTGFLVPEPRPKQIGEGAMSVFDEHGREGAGLW